MFSHDRFHHLKFALEWLLEADRKGWDILVLDDGSRDPRITSYLRVCEKQGMIWASLESPAEGDGNARIGFRRGQAVKIALEKDYDFLLLLDDDILIGQAVLQEVIKDFTKLSAVRKVGALTLHSPIPFSGSFILNNITYGLPQFGGEANVLIPRESMIKFGHQFGPHDKGFGDTFFFAFQKAGYDYIERLNPTFEVQHLGIGSSTIHKDKIPFWVSDLYHNKVTKQYIQVPGFNPVSYKESIQHAGPIQAPQWHGSRPSNVAFKVRFGGRPAQV